MAYYSINMRSQFLTGNETVGIVMPDKPRTEQAESFYYSKKKYRVLWLLHGGMGDYSDWVRKTNIERYACEHNLVVVMPTAMNSQYTSWDNYAVGYDMYRFLIEELMPMIHGWLPVSSRKEDNFIAGISMGGSGVLKYIFENPQLFAAGAVLSWAPYQITYENIQGYKDQPWVMNEIQALGGLDQYLGSRDDIWIQTKKHAGKEIPPLYFSMGEEDSMYSRYLDYQEYAEISGLNAEFHSVPGKGHEWEFWDDEIRKVLKFFAIDESVE